MEILHYATLPQMGREHALRVEFRIDRAFLGLTLKRLLHAVKDEPFS